MGLFGHCAMGVAAKPAAPAVSLGILLLASMILDVLAIALSAVGVEGGQTGNPWSHGLFMSAVWSLAAALLFARLYRSNRAGVVIGLVVFSHWMLDLVSHPIPFDSFSWRTWHWTFGRPMPPDLPLFFAGSTKVGLGLYNSISAVEATILELVMLVVASTFYVASLVRNRAGRG